MTHTDFFDDDLAKPREAAKATGQASSASQAGLPLKKMARHKDEINTQVAHAMEELERLRTRQEDLEQERQELEELRKKQHEYESGKRTMVSHLNRSLVKIEKDEMNVAKLSDVLRDVHRLFKSLHAEVAALDDEAWPEESIREELDKAVTRIDQVRVEYNKALARIEAATGSSSVGGAELHTAVFDDQPASRVSGFGYWFKAGLAASLPLMFTLVTIAVLSYLVYTGAFK